MGYPRLEINVRKMAYNAAVEVKNLAKLGIKVMGVNKVFNGNYDTAEALVKGGIDTVAESRIYNLEKIKDLPCKKCLLRSPCMSQIDDVIRYADISLNSEIEVIRALSKEAVRQNKVHEIIFMVDMGDIREGIWFQNYDEIRDVLREVLTLPNIKIYGLGTNFNCYGTAMPTVENGNLFLQLAKRLEDELHTHFEYLSAGNCTSYHLIDKGIWPAGLNHLRIGGLHQYGIEYVEGKYLDEYYHSSMDVNRYVSDLYIFKAEIIECNTKPTVPFGKLGVDAFLQTKHFDDRGPRKRALLAFGAQDIPYANIWPIDQKISILGQTSDHTIIDIEDCDKIYRVGDIIPFEIDYTALLAACNSPGIEKVSVRD